MEALSTSYEFLATFSGDHYATPQPTLSVASDLPPPGLDVYESESEGPPYLIEYARSGRSKCKGRKPCKGTIIQQDELRLGVLVHFGGQIEGYQWRHWGCVTSTQLRHMHDVFDYAFEIGGFENLDNEDRHRVERAFDSYTRELGVHHAVTKRCSAGEPAWLTVDWESELSPDKTSYQRATPARDTQASWPFSEADVGLAPPHPQAHVKPRYGAIAGPSTRVKKEESPELALPPPDPSSPVKSKGKARIKSVSVKIRLSRQRKKKVDAYETDED